MDIIRLKEKLSEIHQRGYIVSLKSGDRGVGNTLEILLGVEENNLQMPDLGDIEIKGRRNNASNRATMFTFNKGVWKIHPKELIETYGYEDKQGRLALKCTVNSKPNNQGFYLKVEQDCFRLYHEDGHLAAEWRSEYLIDTFKKKMQNVLLAYADRLRNSERKEEFWYKEAYLLTDPDVDKFLELIEQDIIIIDLRMHIKENGSVRNRGTAFRIDPRHWDSCFNNREKLL